MAASIMAATAVVLHRYPPYSHFHHASNNYHIRINSVFHYPQLDNYRSLRLVQKGGHSIQNLRNWGSVNPRSGAMMGDLYGDHIDEDDDEDEEAEEEEDRSLDLLIRFVENVFKKVSRKARKAVKSVLPVPISTRLVICTLGSVVFTSILLIRGIWTGISYLQETRNYRPEDDEPQAWALTRPAM